MRNFKINTGLFCIIILSFYALRLVCSDFMEDVFLIYLIPTFWVIVFIYLKSKNPFENRLNLKKTNEANISIIIIIAFYVLLNFALGLLLSYSKNPYNPQAPLYLWEYVVFAFFQEYVRFLMISKNKNNPVKIIFITIMFIFISIQPAYFTNSFQSQQTIEYVVNVIIPIILENIVFTYFVRMYSSGYILSTVYRMSLGLYTISTPVCPNLRAHSVVLLRIMLIIIIFFKTAVTDTTAYSKKIDTKKLGLKNHQKVNKKKDHVFYAVVFSLSFLTVLFVSGITGYFPTAIASGSMYNSINIGDVVIVKKLTDYEAASTLVMGNVLVYQSKTVLVVHRIVEIGRNSVTNDIYYVTKGDNNTKADPVKVYSNQVIGIARYRMPYVGYPSILAKKFMTIIS